MDNMILGRYIPGNSIVHRLDPRSKLVAMILLIMIVFWANNPITNLILFDQLDPNQLLAHLRPKC